MFKKILIANRGEIACRVISTARRMGVGTVAVYSDADAQARHVAMADEAVRIGPAAVAESYLVGARIIEAALATGAQAVHPGYGFLSENPEFVEAVEAAGLVFIGPTAEAIRAMGLKDAAKARMEGAGVPVVPGYHGAKQDGATLAAEAEAIGYPVMIKARAGGGGKGMRLVDDAAAFAEALAAAQREGQASFGDAHCLIEKFITSPRHIEVQVFGDAHGNIVHLFERDCSLQRRHQKVIEEAPAPDMTDEVRSAMGAAAVEAARAIGYRGAGTVEFIVDGSGPLRVGGFWFMEMNTRLQVEHPVTEAITGLDLVEWQLRVAAGEALPLRQEDLAIEGHAFEARLYAEDASRGFLPSTGVLTALDFPDAAVFERGAVRVDSGVRAGDAISPWYDPMIAKLVVHGPTRAAALGQLRQALTACRIAGSVTNLGFLHGLASDEGFARGEVDTGLIGRQEAALCAVPAPTDVAVAAAALAALGQFEQTGEGPWSALRGFRSWGSAEQVVTLEPVGPVRVTFGTEQTAVFADRSVTARFTGALPEVLVEQAGQQRQVSLVRAEADITVFEDGHAHVFTVADPLDVGAADAVGGDVITAPMPGLVKAVQVTVGQSVAEGEALMLLEAMKMEHVLRAPRAGTVAEVLAADGDQVSDGTLLIALEEEA